ncbi:MAG: DUF6427 family protein [Bacteroidota bacterium]|nr:DUF6427 family protein [Bacteroidota bacterium]
MLLKLFRTGYQTQFFVIVILSALLWISGFISPTEIIPQNHTTPLYNIFTFIKTPIINTIIAYLFVVIQAFMLSSLSGKHKILNLTDLLPALIYIVLMSYNSKYLTLSPALLSNFIIIMFLNILLDIYNTKEPFFKQFKASTLAGIAFLISPANIIILLVIWGSYIIFRNSTLREWIISILGFGMIIFFFLSFIYVTDSTDTFLPAYYEYFSSISIKATIFETRLHPFVATMTLLTLFAIPRMIVKLSEKTINLRKKLNVIIFYAIIVGFSLFTSVQNTEAQIFQLFIPLSIAISLLILNIKKQRYKEMIFATIVIAVIIERVLFYA